MRYTLTMGSFTSLHKSIVTALFITCGFSLPVAAQPSRLDALFDQLEAATPGDVARIEAQIIAEWEKSGSAAMDLLLRRGNEALENGLPDQAVEHLTALVDHAPDFAEGYHARASAYYQLGLYGPAVDDLAQVLQREPRHFGAISGVAIILEELGHPAEALEAWLDYARLSPSDADVAAMIARLEQSLQGIKL